MMTRDDHLADAAEYDATARACYDAASLGLDDAIQKARCVRVTLRAYGKAEWTAEITRADDPGNPVQGLGLSPTTALQDAYRRAGSYYEQRAAECRVWADEEEHDD